MPRDSAAIPARSDSFRGRALVVDDNPINLQVVCSLLQRAGVAAEIARNRVEALRMIGLGRFDIVFMDMQMPVLDGLETTRRLRANGYARPIVGLTANAFTSDRDACLEAGMDDFLSKPLTQAKLGEVLAARLERHDTEAGAEAAVAETPAGPDDASDYRAALISEIGPEVYRTLLDEFAQDGRKLVAAIRATEDPALRDRDLHTLKGRALTLGLQEIAALARIARQDGPAADPALEDLARRVPAAADPPVARYA